jgi:hypothetical protein
MPLKCIPIKAGHLFKEALKGPSFNDNLGVSIQSIRGLIWTCLAMCIYQLWLHTANYKHHQSAASSTPPCPTFPSQILGSNKKYCQNITKSPSAFNSLSVALFALSRSSDFPIQGVKIPFVFLLQLFSTNCRGLKTWPSNMAQRNQADGLPTDSTEENERQPDTSGDNDESLEAEDEIHRARDTDLTIPTTTVQSATAENPSHLEPTLEQSDDEMSSNVRSTSQRGGPGANGGSRLSVESPSHSNENAAGGDEELSQVGAMILDKIMEKLLFKLGAGTVDAPGLYLTFFDPDFSIMVKRNKKVDLVWDRESGTLPYEVTDAIHVAWPRHRHLKGIEQIILESDGTMPVSNVPLQSVSEYLQHQHDRLILQPSYYETRNHTLFSAYESLWHKWCFEINTSPSPSKFRGQIM